MATKKGPSHQFSPEEALERRARMRKLRNDGLSITAIATRFNVSYEAVRYALITTDDKLKEKMRRSNAKASGRNFGVVDPDGGLPGTTVADEE